VSPSPWLELSQVTRRFPRGGSPVVALDGVDLALASGEFLAVTGPSGAGKTTLLAILGCLDRPTSGEVRLEGRPLGALGDREVSRLRSRTFGFVFQAFHLLPALSVAENVELPLLYAGLPERRWRERAHAALAAVGLLERAAHRPCELSGGECQRAAIARALVAGPPVLLCDEPTGNLDLESAEAIGGLLAHLNRDGRTVVVVTHNPGLAARASRQVRLQGGRMLPEERPA